MTAFDTVILPASEPDEPVVTVTLLLANALCRLATVRIELVPDGVQVPAEQVSVGVPEFV